MYISKMLKVLDHLRNNGRTRSQFAKKFSFQSHIWSYTIRNKKFIINGFHKNGTEIIRSFSTSLNAFVVSNNFLKISDKYQHNTINNNNNIRLKDDGNNAQEIESLEKDIYFRGTNLGKVFNGKTFSKKLNFFHNDKCKFSTNVKDFNEDKKNDNGLSIKKEKEKIENSKDNDVTNTDVTNTKNKSRKQLHIDKQYKEKLIKTYLLLSFILIPSGYILMSCIQNNITYDDLIRMGVKRMEIMENKCTEKMNDFIEKYFPVSNEPLLPDFKDLNYPEHLPTLVIDLNYVIAKLEYDRKVGWRVLKRPYADLFFKELSSFYEIVIWSDDNFPVAQEVISKWGIPAIGCLHRDQCIKKKKGYVKDLKRLGRDLSRVIIIDHDPHSFMLQPANGILIKEFNGNVNDKELLCLIDFLKAFAITTMDVSTMLKKYGGGDYDIGRRYLQLKSDTEKKSRRIRNIGKIFHVEGKKSANGVFNS